MVDITPLPEQVLRVNDAYHSGTKMCPWATIKMPTNKFNIYIIIILVFHSTAVKLLFMDISVVSVPALDH